MDDLLNENNGIKTTQQQESNDPMVQGVCKKWLLTCEKLSLLFLAFRSHKANGDTNKEITFLVLILQIIWCLTQNSVPKSKNKKKKVQHCF